MKRIIQLAVAASVVVCLVSLAFKMQELADLRDELSKLRQQSAADSDQIARLDQALNAAKLSNANLQSDNSRLQKVVAEANRRVETERTRVAQTDNAHGQDAFTQALSAFTEKSVARAALLNEHLQAMPGAKIPELGLLTAEDWLEAGRDAKFDTDADVRQSLRKLREIAKNKLTFGSGLYSYTRANDGNLPTDMSQLAPYLRVPVDDSILSRYSILYQGNVSSLPQNAWVIVETGAPVDEQFDNRAQFGVGTSTVIDTGSGLADGGGQP